MLKNHRNRIIANLHGKFSFLPSKIETMAVTHVGPLTIVNSRLPTDMFNIIYINEDTLPGLDEIAEAVDVFKADKLPFAFWLTSEEAISIADALRQCHLNCTEVEWGMCADLTHDHHAGKINESLQIKAVDSDVTLLDWIQVFCDLLPGECSAITNFYQLANPLIQKFNNKIKCYVGYLNNQPVSTCALFFWGNVAGIFDMITVPEMQRQGVATTMMLHALKEARLAGFKQVSLGASEEGKHVYEKLGFKTYCQLKVYNPSYE